MLQIDHVSRGEVHVMDVAIRNVSRRYDLLTRELVALEDHLGLSHVTRARLELLLLHCLLSVGVLAPCLWLLPHSIYLWQLLLVGELHLKNLLSRQL